MKYYSTRDNSKCVDAAQAIACGLAPDGGLFVPECIPEVTEDALHAMRMLSTYQERAAYIMKRYLEDFTTEELNAFVQRAYGDNFDDAKIAPVHELDEATSFLELWHGPTCAFKDMALQMLPHLLTASLKKCGEKRSVCILVATSGDTGKAALAGFADVPNTKICVFYPKDGVSDIQRLQMVTQSGKNVHVCAVEGNFDDAQTGVKAIFSDTDFAAKLDYRNWFLSSANSINWGRLLPQIAYYFSAYCDMVSAGRVKLGEPVNFVVPTGNFGNILAGWYAKQMGLPVARLICASNENNVLTDFIQTGVYDRNRTFHTTISPSMDILISSNLERLLYMLCKNPEQVRGYMDSLKQTGRYTVSDEIRAAVQAEFSAGFCDDTRTKQAISRVFTEHGYLMDSHTAVAYQVLCDYREQTDDQTPAVVVSTASPFKFAADVLEALGAKAGADPLAELSDAAAMPVPKPLARLNHLKVRFSGAVAKEEMEREVERFVR